MSTPREPASRPVALVTGASRRVGIGAAIALELAGRGWDVATTHWTPYAPGAEAEADLAEIDEELRARGARTRAVEADFSDAEAPAAVFDAVTDSLGPVTALILNHAHCVPSTIADTTLESFERHFAINARASWLLVREFAARFSGPPGRGRIVGITSDHVAGNLPYGSSKGALDRIVLAATWELSEQRISANLINPGPTDTGWMSPEQKREFAGRSPLERLGLPGDCAALVGFLCSEEGGWVQGQLLHSDGGFA